jgi:hypothetical protein
VLFCLLHPFVLIGPPWKTGYGQTTLFCSSDSQLFLGLVIGVPSIFINIRSVHEPETVEFDEEADCPIGFHKFLEDI